MSALRPKRHRPVVETGQYGDFIRRAVRAYGRRVGAGEVDELADLLSLRDVVDEAVAQAVAELRDEPHAHSWQRIADVVGMQRWPDAPGARRAGGQPAHLR
jgi:hypothetical protein